MVVTLPSNFKALAATNTAALTNLALKGLAYVKI
jgi:hypothetical protein